MGWKGTLRTINAAANKVAREAERQHKQDVKNQIASEAANSVSAWEKYLDDLLSVHTDLAERIDWQAMLDAPAPREPSIHPQNLIRAENELAAFRPKRFDFFRGKGAKRRKLLEDKIPAAKELDEEVRKKAAAGHAAKLVEWNNDKLLAQRLLTGESSAIEEVVAEMQTFTKSKLVGSAIEFAISDNFVHAKPQVHSDEIVPKFRRKQLASGKLSETKMPTSAFNDLYQDYVSSVALKVAGDLFQILPLEEVFVTCEAEMLNSTTGHKEATPILSVQFVRPTFDQLKLARLDPSDAMANFNHAMKFSRTKGFSAISPLGKDSAPG